MKKEPSLKLRYNIVERLYQNERKVHMNYKQNEKLNQLNEKTLVVGIDVSKKFHVARAQDYRGIEFGKSIKFNNDRDGFNEFVMWFKGLMEKENKTEIVIGMEPTGTYWLPLIRWLSKEEYRVVTVNPAAVKKAKELDDNNQAKTDYRDARVIAQLVKDGRFTEPNLLEGYYEEVRNAYKVRMMITSELISFKNRLVNWFDRFFPEYAECYSNWESNGFLHIIRIYKFPSVIGGMDPNELYDILIKVYPRGIGLKKIEKLVEVSGRSIGVTEGLTSASLEFDFLISKYDQLNVDLKNIEIYLDELHQQSNEVRQIMEIPGIGLVTASGIVAELGDIRKYESPRQLSKMAGLSLTESSSGAKKGQTVISKRGRGKLRRLLYLAVLGMIRSNNAFKELYKYYTKRNINPMTGKEAIVVLMNKLLRIIHALITKSMKYDEEKMLRDIIHPSNIVVVS